MGKIVLTRVQVVEATSSHGIIIYHPENQDDNGKSPFWIADTFSIGWVSIVMSVFRGALFRTIDTIFFSWFYVLQMMHGFVHQQYQDLSMWNFSKQIGFRCFVDIDINLDNEARAGFQTLGHFPWFSWRSKGRNCLGVEQKSQIQSIGINRHILSWWLGCPITSVPLPFSGSASGFLGNLSKQIVASLGVKKGNAWQVTTRPGCEWFKLPDSIHFDLFNPVREGMSSYY